MAALLAAETEADLPAPRELSKGTRRSRVFLAHGGVLLLSIILTVTRAWPLALRPATTIAPDPIDPLYNVWSIATSIHDVATWPDGLWSLFHANIYYPTPHAAIYGDVFIGLLPLSILLSVVIHNAVLLANVLVALSFVVSAYGMFLLGAALMRSYTAATVAALAFGFYPLRTAHIGHLTVLSTEWLIAATYCFVRAWRDRGTRWWLACGLLAGLSAITNLYYLAYLSAPLLVVALVYRGSWTRSRLRGALLATCLGLAIVAPMIAAYAGRRATLGGQYGAAENIDLLSFLSATRGQLVDGALLPNVPIVMTQQAHALFPGFVVAGLAFLGWRCREARPWGVFALACFVLSLGPRLQIGDYVLPLPLPYAWLNEIVPDFRAFRAPEQATIGLSLGLAVLAAYGCKRALTTIQNGRIRLPVAAALIGLAALESWAPVPVAAVAAVPAGERWLAHQPAIHVVLELPIAGAIPRDWQRQTQIMYDSTAHWKNLVNGNASIDPDGMTRRRAILGSFPSPASWRLLRDLHVDAIVLRLTWISAAQRRAAQAQCPAVYRDTSEAICVTPWSRARRRISL